MGITNNRSGRQPGTLAAKPGAWFDVIEHRPIRLPMSELMAAQHGAAVGRALRVAEARRALSTWESLARRDAEAARPVSVLLMEKITGARADLADAEAVLAAAQHDTADDHRDDEPGAETEAEAPLLPPEPARRSSGFEDTVAALLREDPTLKPRHIAQRMGQPATRVSSALSRLRAKGTFPPAR